MAAEMESIKPGSRFRKPVPSCFLMLSNTTVLAGMFTPIAKVSVANSTWERKGRCRQLVELFYLQMKVSVANRWGCSTKLSLFPLISFFQRENKPCSYISSKIQPAGSLTIIRFSDHSYYREIPSHFHQILPHLIITDLLEKTNSKKKTHLILRYIFVFTEFSDSLIVHNFSFFLTAALLTILVQVVTPQINICTP